MSEGLTIDWSDAEYKFGAAMKQMAELTELPLKKVIRAEAGSILKACAGNTKVAQPAKVPGRARSRLIRELGLNRGDVVIASGVRKAEAAGSIAAVSFGPRSKGRHRYAYGPGNPVGKPRPIHWLDRDWTDIEEARFDYTRKVGQAVAAAMRAIGLSRQSWVQIADSLGIRLETVPGGRISAAGIAKARAAVASDGQFHQNGKSREQEGAERYFVDLINGFPTQQRQGFPVILLRAIRGRQAHFETVLKKGVFDSMEKVAQAFPGFYVNN